VLLHASLRFPAPPHTFHIRVALADGDRYGYSIMQEVGARTGGDVRLSPSTLYSAIKRLLEQSYIEKLAERPDPPHDDERRHYYRLTKGGRRAAVAEARQFEKLLPRRALHRPSAGGVRVPIRPH